MTLFKFFSSLLPALVVAWCCTTSVAADGATDPPTVNKYCPVIDGELATPRYQLTHQGKVIHFCCADCVDVFKQNPEIFLLELPQFQQGAAAPGPGNAATRQTSPAIFSEAWWTLAEPLLIEYYLRFGRVVFIALGIAGLLLYVRLKRSRMEPGKWPHRLLGLIAWAPPSSVIIIALGVIIGQLVWTELAENPFAGVRPSADDASGEHDDVDMDALIPRDLSPPGRLQAIYYRGNDERHEKKFNGGNYRTCEFHLSIVDGDAKPAAVGDTIDKHTELFLRVVIVRSPFTEDSLYTDKRVGHAFLSTAPHWPGEPVATEQRLSHRDFTVLESQQRWEAIFPLAWSERPEGAPVDLASATHEQLLKLPGMDAFSADRVIAWREQGNTIQSPADLRALKVRPPAGRALSQYLFDRIANDAIYILTGARDDDSGRPTDGTAHYGIRYRVCIDDGRITADSDLWMAPVFLVAGVKKGTIPYSQWLSPEPIPERREESEPSELSNEQETPAKGESISDGEDQPTVGP